MYYVGVGIALEQKVVDFYYYLLLSSATIYIII